MLRSFKACAVIASGLTMAGAAAQTTDPNDATFQKFIASSPSHMLLINAVRHIPGERLGVCATRFKISDMKFGITKPIVYDSHGNPDSGQWAVQATTDACGTVLNIFFTALGKGDVRTDIGLSGTTRAELQLQTDATPAALQVAKAAAGNTCKLAGMVSARWGGFGLPGAPEPDPGPNAVKRTWWEIWKVLVCNRIYDVQMGFKAVPGDTTYIAYTATPTDEVLPAQPPTP